MEGSSAVSVVSPSPLPSSSSSSALDPTDVEYIEAPVAAASDSSGGSYASAISGDSIGMQVLPGSPLSSHASIPSYHGSPGSPLSSHGSIPSFHGYPGSPLSSHDSIPSYHGSPDPIEDDPNSPPVNGVEEQEEVVTHDHAFNWRNLLKVIGAVFFVAVVALLIGLVISRRTNKRENPISDNAIKYCNITLSVSSDGKSDYRTISDAVEAAPSHSPFRVCIRIGKGEYHEKVIIGHDKSNLTLIGEGAENTTITSNSTSSSFIEYRRGAATLWILGTEFMARDLTVSNTAQHGVAVENWNEHSVFYRVVLRGMNNTLFLGGGDQFYRECDFYGKSYLVLGDTYSFFQKCNFFSEISNSDETTVFLGQSRNTTDFVSGLLIHQCAFHSTGVSTDHSQVFLGSALGKNALIVLMESYLDAPIVKYFINTPPVIDSFFGIFGNSGRGAISSRESVVHALSIEIAQSRFSLRTFLGGFDWIPDEVDRDLDLAR